MYREIFSSCILQDYESNLRSKPHKSDCEVCFVALAATHLPPSSTSPPTRIPSITSDVEQDFVLKAEFPQPSNIHLLQWSQVYFQSGSGVKGFIPTAAECSGSAQAVRWSKLQFQTAATKDSSPSTVSVAAVKTQPETFRRSDPATKTPSAPEQL